MVKKYSEERPWGKFTQFIHNEKCTVKILEVKPQQKLSLQYHNHREEFWVIIEGHPNIIIDEKTIQAKPGDEFTILQGSKHRIIGGEDYARILEIATGNFDEKDIVRLEDDYNRT